jgi:hypothetical protein
MENTKSLMPKSFASLAALAVFAAAGSWAFAAEAHPPMTHRQMEVAKRGSRVMPFDLAKTTHVFDEKPDGGLQTVQANDPHDRVQVRLIRRHLSQLAVQFQHGDFSDPGRVHGEKMPGLAQLKAADGKLQVKYHALPAGATLRYSSADPAVVAAIHQWFAAQRADHAAHGHVLHHHMKQEH